MWKVILSLSLVIVLCSCTKNDGYKAPMFPIEKELKGTCLSSELMITYAYDMCVDDKFIYVLALADDKWVQVYDRQTGEHLGAFVGQGQGPGEVSVGESITLIPNAQRLSVYDQAQRRLVVYKVLDSENSPILSFEKDLNFIKWEGAVRNVWPLENSLLVNGQLGEQDGAPKRFQLLHENEIVSAYNEFPIEAKEKQMVFLSPKVCFTPSMNKMATGILYGGILEIFDLSDNDISLEGIHKFYEPKVNLGSGSINPESGMKYGFSSMCATEDFIYTVLIGDEDPNKLNHLSVFDWSGKGVAKYHTTQLLFKLACVEGEEGKLYALTFEPAKGFSLYMYHVQ